VQGLNIQMCAVFINPKVFWVVRFVPVHHQVGALFPPDECDRLLNTGDVVLQGESSTLLEIFRCWLSCNRNRNVWNLQNGTTFDCRMNVCVECVCCVFGVWLKQPHRPQSGWLESGVDRSGCTPVVQVANQRTTGETSHHHTHTQGESASMLACYRLLCLPFLPTLVCNKPDYSTSARVLCWRALEKTLHEALQHQLMNPHEEEMALNPGHPLRHPVSCWTPWY